VAGFEPTAPRSQSGCATKLRHTPWRTESRGVAQTAAQAVVLEGRPAQKSAGCDRRRGQRPSLSRGHLPLAAQGDVVEAAAARDLAETVGMALVARQAARLVHE
jgi:hypothetical protein